MDFTTFFTLILGFGFTVAVVTAAYAMSISPIEPTLARRASWAAWMFGIVLCVWFGGTNDMLRSYRYGIAALVGAALTVSLASALDYITRKEMPSGKLAAQPAALVAPIASAPAKKPLSMWQLFATDFPNIGRTMMKTVSIVTSSDGVRQQDIHIALYWDFPTNSYFLALYTNKTDDAVPVLSKASNFVPEMIQMMSQLQVNISSPGETRNVSLLTMSFSKQIFLYIDENLSIQQLAEIETAYKAKGYDVNIRTATYHSLHCRDFDRPEELLNFKPINKVGEANVRMPKGSVDGEVITFKNVPSAAVLSQAKAAQSAPPPTPEPQLRQEKK